MPYSKLHYSSERGRICLSCIQFLSNGVSNTSGKFSRWSRKCKVYSEKIFSSFWMLFSPHATKDSNRKLSSASISQLHKIFLSCKTYRWLGNIFWYGVIISTHECFIAWANCKDNILSTV